MSGIFGGGTSRASERSLQAVLDDNLRRQDFIERQATSARTDVLDLIGQGLQPQIDAFQRGNVMAQAALSQGVPQVQAALLGTPVDMSVYQPRQVPIETQFLQQAVSEMRANPPQPTQYRAPLVGAFGQPIGFNFGGGRG